MSWQDEPATWSQKLALRNQLDKRYGLWQGGEIYRELEAKGLTKGRASEELKRLYSLKNK